MKIFRYPHPILSEVAEPVTVGKEADYIVRKLIQACAEVKWGKPGGMAAPQIGISRQVFVVGPQAFLNPRIVDRQVPYESQEGCYSLEADKHDYEVERHMKIQLEWTDIDGNEHKEWFQDMKAKIIEHEYDHLLGKLCSGTSAVGGSSRL